ncbi:hypothetical protein J5N97_016383 [Dioscorea zingiberensis]|uniref:Uncharacterized protein n=1 Tax=Dioscorea zingiberensis TaxID=325984 RepID=A0A9D5HFK8_9LILI|nr:hypothetical protein J5N97_016383 [Dioscorea zingiberensis]
MESKTDDVKLLRSMVCKLQHVHHLLMSDGAPCPSNEEIHLYCLIARHVRIYIMVFYFENTPSSLGEPSNHRLTGFLNPQAPVDETCHLSPEEIKDKFQPMLEIPHLLSRLLSKGRKIASRIYRQENKYDNMELYEGDINAAPEVVNVHLRMIREEILWDILRALEEMGRARSYAPPAEEHIKYYEEIRREITSCFACIDAISHLRKYQISWDKLTLKDKCKARWDVGVSPICYSIEYMPKPYKFVVGVDWLFDCMSILHTSKNMFSDLCSSFHNSSIAETTTERKDLCLEATNSSEAGKKMKYDTAELNVATRMNEYHGETSETGEKKNRVQYLQLIQKALEKMRTSSWFKHMPEVAETRLYTQLMEHVFSSMLVFERRQHKPRTREREEKFHHEEPEDMAYYRWASTEPGKLLHQEGSVPNEDAIDEEMKTREQCLEKIKQCIDGLGSTYLNIVPTDEEIIYYRKLKVFLSVGFMGSSILDMALSPVEGSSDVAMLKRNFGDTHYREMKVLGQIEILLAEMVKDAFPDLRNEVVDPFKWVRDNYSDPIMRETVGLSVAAKVVKSGFDFTVLDRMVALLFEVTELNDIISSANGWSDGLAREVKRQETV